jgi:DNA repair protein RecN (Recombination protein N)
VLCITHLAQIAACGSTHFTVQKVAHAGRTRTELSRLADADARRREIARMLSGHITDASLKHASELVERGAPPAKKGKAARA